MDSQIQSVPIKSLVKDSIITQGADWSKTDGARQTAYETEEMVAWAQISQTRQGSADGVQN